MSKGHTVLYDVSRIMMYIFIAYMLYTLSVRHFPDDLDDVTTFLFLFFWNVGVQWVCFRLIHLAIDEREEQILFTLQLAMISWIVYTYRFVYISDMPYDRDQFLNFPLQQYGILLVLFLFMLVRYTGKSK